MLGILKRSAENAILSVLQSYRVYRGLIQAYVLMWGDWEKTRVYGKNEILQCAYKV